MDINMLKSTDITGGSFSLMLAGSIGATVLLLLGTGWVAKKWKLPVALAAIITLVATLYYFQAREVWLVSGHMPVIYRYIDWLITIPVQVLALFFFIGALMPPPTGLFWRLLVVAVITILARYMGEAGFMYATLGFLIGIVGWLYILGEVFFGKLSEISVKHGNETVQTGFFWLRLIITVGWAIYPLCNFIATYGGGVEEGRLSIVYNLADVVNQIAFGMVILAVAMEDSTSTR